MREKKLRIAIVDKDEQRSGVLKRYLDNKLSEHVEVSLRFRGKSCQRMKHQGVNIVVMDPLGSTYRIRSNAGTLEEQEGSLHDLESGLIVMASPEEVEIEVDPHTSAAEFVEEAVEAPGKVQRNFLKPVGEWIRREGVMEYLVLFLVYFVTISSLLVAALSFAI